MSSPKRIVTTADLLRTHLDLAMQFVHAYTITDVVRWNTASGCSPTTLSFIAREIPSRLRLPAYGRGQTGCKPSLIDSLVCLTLVSAPALLTHKRFEFLDQIGNGYRLQLCNLGCCYRVHTDLHWFVVS